MGRTTIYGVFASDNYEADSIIKAFRSKVEAEAFCVRCTAHWTRRPDTPGIEQTDANDAEWDRWEKRLARWETSHPAGRSASNKNCFTVVPITLIQ